jgi:hypothetical protein
METLVQDPQIKPVETSTAPQIDVTLVDQWVKEIGGQAEHLIPLLQAIQKKMELPPQTSAGATVRSF